jgi:hypothetical protein
MSSGTSWAGGGCSLRVALQGRLTVERGELLDDRHVAALGTTGDHRQMRSGTASR